MESFCGSPFWDSNRTWYTNNPQFTPCFEKTLLVWLPWAFLSLLLMGQIYSAMKLQRGKIPISLLGFLQIGLTCILIILQIIDFSFTFQKSDDIKEKLFPADHAQPATKAVTFALALFLQMFTKRKGIQSSTVLFIFWLLVATCSLPEFTSEIQRLPLENEYNFRKIHALTIMICYPTIVVEFILNCFADRAPVPPYEGCESAKQTESEGNRPCPQKSSSVLNQWTFQWVYPLLWKGYRGTLNFSDLWDLNEEDNTSTVTKRFMKYWKPELEMAKEWNTTVNNKTKELSSKRCNHNKAPAMENNKVKKKTASILPALWKSNRSSIVVSGVLMVIHSLLSFVSPFMLSSLISHVESDGTEESWKGYLYVGAMLIQGFLQTLFFNWHAYLVLLTGMRLRSALTEALYQKSLVISNKSRKDSKLGEIVNLMSVDTQRFQEFMQYSHQMWVAPLKIGLALYFLWGYLGVATISGVVFLVILVPVHAKMTEWVRNLRAEQIKKQDERIRLTKEILSGIKALKLYAWEPPFQDRVESIRQMELDILRRLACINAFGNFLSFMSPVLVAIASFATFVLMDSTNVLDAETTFVSLTLFNIMRLPFGILPLIIGQLVQVQVSLKRINKFMSSDEINPEAVSHDYPEHEMLVSVADGKFTWDETMSTPTLQNINLNVKKGTLIAVVGNVGSGKSSLLSAILGDMEIQSGRVNTFGSIAYVAQQAWIQNATFRDNILFGREFDPILYERIVESCALKADIRIFPGGDQTEIGEKGINLSGGQKQRVALARAVYNDADIYLLDDPLSAVDSHVGKQLFQEVIGPHGMLKEKTRILITHGMTFLPHVDYIVLMNNGEIIESGNYKEILMRKTALADFLVQHDSVEDAKTRCGSIERGPEAMPIPGRKILRNLFNGTKTTPKPSVVRGGTTNTSDMLSIVNQKSSTDIGIKSNLKNISEDEAEMNPSKLIGVERAEIGNVKAQVYGYFLEVMGLAFVVTSVVSFTIGYGVNIYSNFWLSNWSAIPTKNGIQDTEKRNMYLTVYCALGVVQSIAMYLANITLLFGFLRASAVLHKSMLSRVLRAPMSFFDATPTGRILNRFSKDMDVLDTSIGQMVYQSISSLYAVLSVLIVISINMPIFLTVVTPVTVVYICIQRFYAATSRQLRRLGSISRSPVFTHFGETLAGLSTIRAFKVQRQFLKELERKLDMDLVTTFLFICTNRWIAFILECMGNLIVMFAGMFTLLYHIDGGKTGLSISYALSITVYLNFLIKQTLEVETNTVAIERMKEYCDIPQEAAWYVADQKPGTEWPQHGNIIFRDFQTRYRHNLGLVLRKVDCNISRGEKVGIVGRTGSGKSSLTLSLFRILEASEGAILIDGEDISKMGLQDIRGRLTIIPQDPVLFVGSLRLNLDPSGKHSDDTIWQSLEHAHLKDFVASLPEGLNAIVEESGKNFSVGQMQLVCLARALLRKTKILILDEATAAVDMKTDELIQQTIRSEFKDCTILTVAHRLNTIMDSDRVMVLDNGEIQEFDSPSNLMSNKKSIFYGMVKEAGLV